MRRPVRASDAAGACARGDDDDARGTRGAKPQTRARGRPFRDVREGAVSFRPVTASVPASHEPLSPAASATSASLASGHAHMMVAPFTAPDASSVPPHRKKAAYISLYESTARPFADTEPGTKRPRPEPELPAGGGSRDRHDVPRVSTATKRARVTERGEPASPRVASPKRRDENNAPVSSASSDDVAGGTQSQEEDEGASSLPALEPSLERTRFDPLSCVIIATSICSDDDAKQDDGDDDDDDDQRVLLLLTPVTAASQLAQEFDELDTA